MALRGEGGRDGRWVSKKHKFMVFWLTKELKRGFGPIRRPITRCIFIAFDVQ